METPDLKSCGLRGFLLRCSASDALEFRSTGATKSYVVAAINYRTEILMKHNVILYTIQIVNIDMKLVNECLLKQ